MADPTQRDGDEEPEVQVKATASTRLIDDEDVGDPGEFHSKYDPNLIRVDPRTFSLHQIIDMLDAGELDLTPDFQRKKVWKHWQKSRVIESILLRIPLPAFYFAADGDGLIHVVDGLQRLSTIYDFVKGKPDFSKLSGLEYLTEDQIGGLTWETLGGSWKRRLHTTQIFAHVIDPQTPLAVKFQIFQRLNQGGEPLTSHEIRNSISRERSRGFLREHANSPAFLLATGHALKDHPRMADLEAVLRICAFRMEQDIGAYESFESLDDFLTSASRRLDNEKKYSLSRLAQLGAEFEHAMENALCLFGKHAFRKQHPSTDNLFPLNKPLLESWGSVLADYETARLDQKKDAIVAAFRMRLQEDDSYRAAISYRTTTAKNVRYRKQVAIEILERELK